jgi:molybdenum cofactor cytidylyltransferase
MNATGKAGEKEIAAIILSAGKSERFGKPKAFLQFLEKQTFLEKLIQVYLDAGIKKIIVVTNEDIIREMERIVVKFRNNSDILLIMNKHPEAGRFSSIQLGLEGTGEHVAAFIQNIDNPFTTPSLLENMKSKLEQRMYVVPVFQGVKGHPVLLSSGIINHIREIAGENANLRDILNEFDGMEVNADDERIHANINTEADYHKYFAHETDFKFHQ